MPTGNKSKSPDFSSPGQFTRQRCLYRDLSIVRQGGQVEEQFFSRQRYFLGRTRTSPTEDRNKQTVVSAGQFAAPEKQYQHFRGLKLSAAQDTGCFR